MRLTGRSLAGALLSLLFTASAALAQTFDPELLKQLVRDNRDSVVLLRGDASTSGTSTGTGFFLQDGRLITNWHVVDEVRNLRAMLTDGRELAVERIVAADEQRDLALLQLRAASPAAAEDADDSSALPPGLPLAAPSLAEQGEPVLVIGSPLGLGGSVSTGIVAAQRPFAEIKDDSDFVRDLGPEDVLLQITAGIAPGSSGSPVLDRRGAVIGVVVSGYNLSQNLNFAIPVREVYELLQRPTGDAVRVFDASDASLHPTYLRNLLISVLFFGFLWLIYRRLR